MAQKRSPSRQRWQVQKEMIQEIACAGLIAGLIHRQVSKSSSGLAYMLASSFVLLIDTKISDAAFWLHYVLCVVLGWIVFEFAFFREQKNRLSNFVSICCIISGVLNLYGSWLWWSYQSPAVYNLMQEQLTILVILAMVADTGGNIIQRVARLFDWVRRAAQNAALCVGKILC